MINSTHNPKVVITGGAGFIGSNLAASFAQDGFSVLIVDNFSRKGVEQNWLWLREQYGDLVHLEQGDIRNPALVENALKTASCVFHFAAQVAVTESLDAPFNDFNINLRGTLVWLEAIRNGTRPIPFIYSSTNKVYGSLADVLFEKEPDGWVPCDRALRSQGVDEKRSLDFHTPYGCSKGGADQYTLDYGRHFQFPSTALRMSCIYGPRQWGSEDQGWLAHFASSMMQGETITLFGDGRQIRDVLYIDDAVRAYRSIFENIQLCSGQAFNLGGGPENAVSLLTAIEQLEGLVGASARIEFAPWRAGDQRWYASNSTAIRTILNLPRPISWRDGLAEMADWLRHNHRQIREMRLRPCA